MITFDNIITFLTKLIENHQCYFPKKYNSLTEEYEVVVNSNDLIKFINTIFTPEEIQYDNFYSHKVITLHHRSISINLAVYDISCQLYIRVNFYSYYYYNRFSPVRVKNDNEHLLIILVKLFTLNHLFKNKDLQSFNKKITKLFLQCYLQYIDYIVHLVTDLPNQQYVFKVLKNGKFLYTQSVSTDNIDMFKRDILKIFIPIDRNLLNDNYGYDDENNKFEFKVRKRLEYFSDEEDYEEMLLAQEDEEIRDTHIFLKHFHIEFIIIEDKRNDEVKQALCNNTIEMITNPKVSNESKVFYSINETIEYIKKTVSENSKLSEEYKEIFLPLLKDRRFANIKPVFQIE